MYDAVALGELLIDFTCVNTDADGYPAMAAHPGGAPANYLAALSAFGAKTALIGKVGDDSFGALLKSTLEKAGIDASGIVSDGSVFTTLAFVLLDENGDRDFSFSRKPGADTCLRYEEIDLGLIDRTKVFHFGTLSLTDEPSRTSTYRAVEYAKSLNKVITFDPNLRKPLWSDLSEAKKQIDWGLGMADIVKISDEEVSFMWGLSPEEGAGYIIDTCGAKLVFVTCGADGCFYMNKNASGFVPALGGIDVTDTTGAGDIFFGSAMYKILKSGRAPGELDENDLRRAVRFACASAGLSATKSGGISSVPGLEDAESAAKTIE